MRGVYGEVQVRQQGVQLGEGHFLAQDAEDVLVRDGGVDLLAEVALGEVRRQTLGRQDPKLRPLAEQALESPRRDAGDGKRSFARHRQGFAGHVRGGEQALPRSMAQHDGRNVGRGGNAAVRCRHAKRVEEAGGHALGEQTVLPRTAIAVDADLHLVQAFNRQPLHLGNFRADFPNAGGGHALHPLGERRAPADRDVLLLRDADWQMEPDRVGHRGDDADEAKGKCKRTQKERLLGGPSCGCPPMPHGAIRNRTASESATGRWPSQPRALGPHLDALLRRPLPPLRVPRAATAPTLRAPPQRRRRLAAA